MIDDRTLKYINDLKRTLDSSGLMDAVRLAEEHRKALGAVGDFALATDILKHQKLLDGFLTSAVAEWHSHNPEEWSASLRSGCGNTKPRWGTTPNW